MVIEFLFHHRFSDTLGLKILPNFIDNQRLPTGLQNKYTAYCRNFVGDTFIRLSQGVSFPFTVLKYAFVLTIRATKYGQRFFV